VSQQLRISVFTQHHLDSFDLSVSPLHNMMVRFPKASEADLRAHLGGYEIHGTDALKPMKFSSGGQKSRVAFAAMTFNRPHVVILDEPTNHLDMESIKALSNALRNFAGGVLLISHDQYFIKRVCDEIWVIENAAVKTFHGSFDEYKKSQLAKLQLS
jgi:ATP-binding cassette, subfamily F, member 3